MNEPDVIGDDRGRSRGMTAFVVVVALALLAALAVSSLHHKGSSHATPSPSSPSPSSPPPSSPSPSAAPPSTAAPPSSAPTPVAAGPKVVLRVGDEIVVAVDDVLVGRDELPADATNVWATTLTADSSIPDPNPDVIHLFGLSGGRAFQQDIGPTSTASADLGAATAVLQTQEYPVLVHDGDPVVVGDTALPPGWQPGQFEDLGYSGLLVKPVDATGNVEIASWSPGGVPHPVTKSGQLLGVSDAGQATWLDPTCPDGPHCALFFGDIGGIHPEGGVPAPAGARFVDSPASLGGGGYLAAAAVGAQGEPILVLVCPWQGTAAIINGSVGVVASSGMFWLDGRHLIFAAENAATGGALRLMEFDVSRLTVTPFGPPLPRDAQLLTAFGSIGGVTGLP